MERLNLQFRQDSEWSQICKTVNVICISFLRLIEVSDILSCHSNTYLSIVKSIELDVEWIVSHIWKTGCTVWQCVYPLNNCCFHYSIFSIFAQISINNHKFCRRYQCTQCLHQIHIILHKKHTTCILYLELTVYEVWIEKYVSWNAASVSKSQQHSWKKTAGPVLEVCSAESLLDGNSWDRKSVV